MAIPIKQGIGVIVEMSLRHVCSSCFVTMSTQSDGESVHIMGITLAEFVKENHLNILVPINAMMIAFAVER